jgi:HK97 family phage major capsid protein
MRTAIQLNQQARDILERADDDGRELTQAEADHVDQLLRDAEAMGPGRRIRAEGFAPQRSRTTPAPLGNFFRDVKLAGDRNGGIASIDAAKRLRNAPTTFGSENVGADGGFAVPPEFRAEILQKVLGEDQLISLCDQVETGSNSLTVPKDETTPWGSAGIQAYWGGEAQQLKQSKAALENATIRLDKLTAFVPVSNELLEDAPALGSYLQRKTPQVMQFKINDAIINGTGAGQPLGILNSPCLVTVNKESSQPSATLLAANVIKMYNRMLAEWRTSAVWLVNEDVTQQLMQMTVNVQNVAGTENVGGWPVFVPPGRLSDAPFGALFGRPIVPTQACQTLGTVGDIIFASLGQYAAIIKAGGIQAVTSIHVFFDYDMTVFRFVFRMGGQPWWSTTLAAKNGSNTYSPFVALQTR